MVWSRFVFSIISVPIKGKLSAPKESSTGTVNQRTWTLIVTWFVSPYSFSLYSLYYRILSLSIPRLLTPRSPASIVWNVFDVSSSSLGRLRQLFHLHWINFTLVITLLLLFCYLCHHSRQLHLFIVYPRQVSWIQTQSNSSSLSRDNRETQEKSVNSFLFCIFWFFLLLFCIVSLYLLHIFFLSRIFSLVRIFWFVFFIFWFCHLTDNELWCTDLRMLPNVMIRMMAETVRSTMAVMVKKVLLQWQVDRGRATDRRRQGAVLILIIVATIQCYSELHRLQQRIRRQVKGQVSVPLRGIQNHLLDRAMLPLLLLVLNLQLIQPGQFNHHSCHCIINNHCFLTIILHMRLKYRQLIQVEGKWMISGHSVSHFLITPLLNFKQSSNPVAMILIEPLILFWWEDGLRIHLQ